MNTLEISQNASAILEGNPLFARLLLVSVELAFLAGIVALCIWLLRIRAPRVRALLWLLVLAKPILGLAIGTPLPLIQFEATEARRADSPRPVEEIATGNVQAVQANPGGYVDGVDAVDAFIPTPPSPAAVARTTPEAAPPAARSGRPLRLPPLADLLAGLWLLGVVACVVLTIRGQGKLRKLRRAAGEPPEALKRRFQVLAREMRVRRVPIIRVNSALSSPALIGLVRPVVLLPQWMIEKADSQQLDWLLRHELMHWKLRDPMALAVRRLAEILFFFHPVVWWAGRRWEEAMELACDRALLQTNEDARVYAAHLYRVLESQPAQRPASHAAGLFATRTQIGKRIAALLSNPLRSPAHLSLVALGGLALAALISLPVGIGLVQAQSTKPPAQPKTSRVWGKEVNGLRAAVELVPERERYALGELIGVRVHLQNVSTHTLRLAWTDNLKYRGPTVVDENSKTYAASSIFVTAWPTLVHRSLDPGEEVVLEKAGVRFVDRQAGAGPGDLSATVWVDARLARYFLSYELRLPDAERGERPRPDFPQSDLWRGMVQTGAREMVFGSGPTAAGDPGGRSARAVSPSRLTPGSNKTALADATSPFDRLDVKMRCFWYGPLHREMTIRGDGRAEFALVTGQNETTYSAKFQLSEQQQTALVRALEATRWLELPPETRMATDAVEFEVALTRNDRTRRAKFMVQRKPPYQDLELILANFEKQEYTLYKLTEMTESHRIEAARDIQGELSGRMGRPHRSQSPLSKYINYARYVPVMIPWLKRPNAYRQDEIAAAIDLASYLKLASVRDQIKALRDYRTYSDWDCVCEYLLRLGDRRAASVLKEMALKRSDNACWALIRMGEPAEQAIADVLRVPPTPNQDPSYKMIRVYLDRWHELPAPVPPVIAQAMRDARRAGGANRTFTEYHDRLLRLLEGGKPVQGLRVSIKPRKLEYGEGEPVLVDWKIENVGNEAKKILWHPLHFSPIVFELMLPGGTAFLTADYRRVDNDRLPEPPQAVILQPGESREMTVDLRHFHPQAPTFPLGSYVVAGYYWPRSKPAMIPAEFLNDPKFADAVLNPIGSEVAQIAVLRQPTTREAERDEIERRMREDEETERRASERRARAIAAEENPRAAEVSRFEGPLEFNKNIAVGLRLGPQGVAGHETFVINTQWIRFFARDGATRVGMLLHLGPSRVVVINWRVAVDFLGADDRTLGRAEALIQTNVMPGTAEAYLPFAGSPWSEVAKATTFRLTIEPAPAGATIAPVGLHLMPPPAVPLAARSPTTPASAAWGKPAEGVQCHLTADKAVWTSGELPTFKLAVRNEGVRDFGIFPSETTCEIEWDGRRYGGPPVMAPEFPFEPGRQYNAIRVSLDYKWQDKDTLEPLRITPGKHTIRVAAFPTPEIRAASNPVEIEIQNEPGKPPPAAEISRFEGPLEFNKNIPVGLRLGPQGDAGRETFIVNTQWIRFFPRDGATRVGMLLHLGPSKVVRINWRIAVEFLGDDDRTLGRAEVVNQTNVMRGTYEAYLPFAGSPWSEVAKATKFRLAIDRAPADATVTAVGLHLIQPGKPASAASAPTTEAPVVWGEPAEGVQCRLTADKAIWASGEFPTFKLAVRNEGVRDFTISRSQATCEIEWDGRIFAGPPVMAQAIRFEPGRQCNAVPVSLDYKWQDEDKGEPLRVTPGKHTIRVAVFARPNVRAVSNPVEIEISNDSTKEN